MTTRDFLVKGPSGNATLGQAILESFTKAQLDVLGAGTAGRLALVTDDVRGVWIDTGTAWIKLFPYVNAMDFGLVADGSTDNYAAINNARLAAASSTQYKRVWLPAGNINVNQTFAAWSSGVSLLGSGMQRTILRHNAARAGFLGMMFDFTAAAVSNVEFANFTINGQDLGSGANATGGFRTGSGQTNWHVHDIEIINLRGTDGVAFDVYADDSTFENIRIDDVSDRGGISLNSSDRVRIANNVVTNTGDDGISTHGRCRQFTITGNVVSVTSTSQADAFKLNGLSRSAVTGNTGVGALHGMDLTGDNESAFNADLTDVTVSGNTLIGGADDGDKGINVQGFAAGNQRALNIEISGNVIEQGGIRVIDASNIQVSDNILRGSSKAFTSDQITIEASALDVSNVRVDGNHLQAPNGVAFAFTAAASTTLSDVQVNNNKVDTVVAAGGLDHGFREAGAGTFSNLRAEGNLILGAATRTSTTALTRRNNRWTNDASFAKATLVGGTVTVSTAEVEAGDTIHLTRAVANGTLGHLSVGTITAGTSFVINSSSGTDTSTIFWEIHH